MTMRALTCLFAVSILVACGPIGPFEGGRLSGADGGWPVDWNHAADVEQVQLETGVEDPHSVNVWIVVVDQVAYLATSLFIGTEVPDERGWVRNVADDPRARIRIDRVVYSVQLETVGEASVKVRVLAAFSEKYPRVREARGDGAHFYRIAERAETPAQ